MSHDVVAASKVEVDQWLIGAIAYTCMLNDLLNKRHVSIEDLARAADILQRWFARFAIGVSATGFEGRP